MEFEAIKDQTGFKLFSLKNRQLITFFNNALQQTGKH